MAKKRKVKKYWWFDSETVSALIDQLNRAGGARLEVRIDEKQAMTLQVVPAGVEADRAPTDFAVLNKSHICPPFCP